MNLGLINQETLEYEESENPLGMSDYASRSAAEISVMINKILTKTMKKGGEARGVSRELTAEWFGYICRQLTTDHIDALTAIETGWAALRVEGKLKNMEVNRNIIEEFRPMDTVVDESVDHDWTWRQLTRGAGSLMNMIVFMIRKATGQSTPMAAANELLWKMR